MFYLTLLIECQNDKTAAISQLHDMFPGESDNTLQQTLQSSINMEDAVDKLLNSGNISLKHS